jgi:hypothetical protein
MGGEVGGLGMGRGGAFMGGLGEGLGPRNAELRRRRSLGGGPIMTLRRRL